MENETISQAPSDVLEELYDRRAELEYASPPVLATATASRKFKRMFALLRETLPAASVLDAGCGDGRYLAALADIAPRPERLVGVDISARILATAGETLAGVGLDAQLVRANVEELPFADASFDRVLSVQVLEHLLAPRRGVDELTRVLSPGGVLVLSTDNTRNRLSRALNLPRSVAVKTLRLEGRRSLVTFPHRSFTTTEVTDLLTAAGLIIERLETFRLHLDPPFDSTRSEKWLATLDEALPGHGWGDLIAVVARKPAA